jgi:hypothetical protein
VARECGILPPEQPAGHGLLARQLQQQAHVHVPCKPPAPGSAMLAPAQQQVPRPLAAAAVLPTAAAAVLLTQQAGAVVFQQSSEDEIES